MTATLETVIPAAEVEVEGLAHHYAPGRGLDPLSFVIAAPGAVAVTGPNGSGKSTLLRILAGLLRPNRGRVRVSMAGAAIAAGSRRGAIGYAGPELAFYEELSAAENLGFAAEALGIQGARESVSATLARVGLERRAQDRVAALSSGMKQRLRIAFALLERPPLLLLDEPGSHLDDDGRAMVARVVGEQARLGLVVLATNDEREWKLAEQRIELRGRGLGHPA